MTITERVQKQFFSKSPSPTNRPEVVRLPLTIVVKYSIEDKATRASESTTEQSQMKAKSRRTNLWSVEEHNRFLHGLELFPKGPWKHIASVVGTKTTRQTMTHAQKYRQKIERNMKADETLPRAPTLGDPRSVATNELLPTVPVLKKVSECFPQVSVLERPLPRWFQEARMVAFARGV